MSFQVPVVLLACAVGVGATLTMDVWNLFLAHALGIRSLDFCLLGRWIGHMREGVFRHASIQAAAPRPLECALGWLAHYTTGVTFALGLVGLLSSDWLVRPTLLPALTYGVVTVAFPFLIMQPSLGLGIAASKTSHPTRARLKSIATHVVFGLGLYLSALSLRYALG